MVEAYNDEWLAIQQGTSPIVRAADGSMNYARATAEEQGVFGETGGVSDPEKYAALRDPDTGKLAVWNRNPEMDDSRAVRLGRLLGAGLLTDPLRGTMPARTAMRGVAATSHLAGAAAKANAKFGEWVDGIHAAREARAAGKPFANPPRMVRVGVMDEDVQNFVRSQGIHPASADITATDKGIFHLTREAKTGAGKAVPLDMARRMPEVLGNPSAVLWDKKKGNLAYVFDVPGDPKKGKFVVTVNFRIKAQASPEGKRITHVINDMTTGGVVQPEALTDTNTYDLIKGKL